jgi:hypothetical protein
LLKKLIKKKLDLHGLALARAEGGEEDDTLDQRVHITIPDFKTEASKMDIRSIEEYLESDLFLDSFEVENGKIMKRNDFEDAMEI